MADNVTANSGSGGATFATDDIGGVHYPITKITFGALDAQTIASSNTGTVDAGTQRVTVATDDALITAVQLIDDAIYADDADWTDGSSKHALVGGLYQSSPQSITDGDVGPIQVNSNGDVKVEVATALPAGTNAIGKLAANSGVDIGDVDVLSIAAGANLVGDVGISGARTSGGTSFFYDNDLDETKVEVKATAGQLYWFHVMNIATAVRYLQVFNKAAASVTVGTTVPDLQFVLPTQGDSNGAGFTLSVPNGIAMGTGITIAATTDSQGSGAPGANEVHINLGYA